MDNLVEGERCHLECRLEPINDPDLKVEWFVNGVEIKAGKEKTDVLMYEFPNYLIIFSE